MKKIGIDARLYSQTGIGVYLRNLIHFLHRSAGDDTLFYIYLMDDDYDKIVINNNHFIRRRTNANWHSFKEQTVFLKELYQDELDLMHFTYFSYPILYRRKFIATIHDTTPLHFKTGGASTRNSLVYEIKHLIFRLVLSTQIKNARLIITPTNYVKNKIIAQFGRKYEDKVKTIYEGVNYELINCQQKNDLINIFKRDFLIYVGNFYPHKNVDKLIKAFATIKTDMQLVLIGPKNYFSVRLLQLIDKLKQEKRIIFFHNATNEELAFFYKNAKSLINPSLSEGFGLPLMEAAYFNLPIIASNIAVFRELLGDNYLKFDQNNIEDIADKINSFLKSPQKFDYQNIITKYSFAKMTEYTRSIYKRALQ